MPPKLSQVAKTKTDWLMENEWFLHTYIQDKYHYLVFTDRVARVDQWGKIDWTERTNGAIIGSASTG